MDKYRVNDEVRLMTRGLVTEEPELASRIREQIAKSSVERRLDDSQDEYKILLSFQELMSEGDYVAARESIEKSLKARPDSVLLNMQYAKYLEEVERRTKDAIRILEGIRQASGNDQEVLRLLMTYYIALEVPNYQQASSYARELEGAAEHDIEIKMALARFYVAWSTSLKMKRALDPIKEMLRQRDYKEKAEKAIHYLMSASLKTHEWHHLLAQGYFNNWEYDKALRHIDGALKQLSEESPLHASYKRLHYEILKKQERYG